MQGHLRSLWLIWVVAAALAEAADGGSDLVVGERGQLLPQASARVRGTKVTLKYDGLVARVPCASPTNCGAGYSPGEPHFTVEGCDAQRGCPVVVSDLKWPNVDGSVGFKLVPLTPERFSAALAACRLVPDASSNNADCRYLYDVAAFGQATAAQAAALNELAEARRSSSKAEGRVALERQCAGGRALSCVTLARQVRGPERETAITLATRACRLGLLAGCREAVVLLGNETSETPARVLAVIELACDQRLPGFCEELVRRLKTGIGVQADPELASRIDAVFRTTKGPIREQLKH